MDNILKELLETSSTIFIKANESYLFARYFDTAHNESEQSVIKKPSVRFIQNSLWKNCIIELDKMFGVSGAKNHYSFISIFTYINKNRNTLFTDDSEYKILFQKWSDFRKDKELLICQINKLRKQLYAHTDPGKDQLLLEIDISYSEIEDILQSAFSLIKEIKMVVFDADFRYEPIFFRNVKIVQTIAEQKQLKREQRVNKILNENPRP